MRKLLLQLLSAVLVVFLVSCGGGNSQEGSSQVGVKLGNKSLGRIPPTVTEVTITISAPDIPDIVRNVDVAGREEITETFIVTNGANRTITVVARDAQHGVQFRGFNTVNIQGAPVVIAIPMQNAAPPRFSGLSSADAISTTQIDLSWAAATDNVTPAENIVYLIYASPVSGGQSFTSPTFTTSEGATSFSVTGLSPGTTYFFVVRALNKDGFLDSNLVERSATTFPPLDLAPVYQGITSAVADPGVTGRITLSWAAATDDVTPAADLVYLIYRATAPGQQNFMLPTATTPPGATSYTNANLPPGTYYFVVRARDGSGNIDQNLTERSATTVIPSLTATSGNNQSAVIYTAFATPLQATVRDAANRPASGVSVTFTAPTSGASGTFSNGSATISVATNDQGVATAPFTANSASGTYTVTASSGTLAQISFTLTNLPAPPASITATGGSGQSTVVGTAFGTQLQATVRDVEGNPISGETVTFTVPDGAPWGTFPGNATTTPVRTDARGIATAPPFTAGSANGSYEVTATIGTLPAARFALTNQLGQQAMVSIEPPEGGFTVGSTYTSPFVVTVTDAGSNPLAGIRVELAVPPTGAGGEFTGGSDRATMTTLTDGTAASPDFATNLTTGPFTVTATVPGSDVSAQITVINQPVIILTRPSGI